MRWNWFVCGLIFRFSCFVFCSFLVPLTSYMCASCRRGNHFEVDVHHLVLIKGVVSTSLGSSE